MQQLLLPHVTAYVFTCCLLCVYMPAIDRSLSDCIVYTCRRLIDLSPICRYTELKESVLHEKRRFPP